MRILNAFLSLEKYPPITNSYSASSPKPSFMLIVLSVPFICWPFVVCNIRILVLSWPCPSLPLQPVSLLLFLFILPAARWSFPLIKSLSLCLDSFLSCLPRDLLPFLSSLFSLSLISIKILECPITVMCCLTGILSSQFHPCANIRECTYINLYARAGIWYNG